MLPGAKNQSLTENGTRTALSGRRVDDSMTAGMWADPYSDASHGGNNAVANCGYRGAPNMIQFFKSHGAAQRMIQPLDMISSLTRFPLSFCWYATAANNGSNAAMYARARYLTPTAMPRFAPATIAHGTD